MKKIFLSLFSFSILTSTAFSKLEKTDLVHPKNNMYQQLHIANLGLKEEVFNKAIAGWNVLRSKHQLTNSNFLSIVDFSQSSNAKRLYVIDMEGKKILFHTYVAHGRNSGNEFATTFSNDLNSFQSSLGFYVTENTYKGTHGLSMRLKGVEKNINDYALARGIVLHGAEYVCESFIKQNGRLGRSQGCPAVPLDLCEPIVNSIKGGTCFFIYYPDKVYEMNSEFGL